MTEIILQKLNDIELKYNVTILYACETGSRAWGFPSTDSDYDVRFIYAFKDYLTINDPRDVIEYQIDETWDITGWELRKALRLLKATNSAMIERLNSPIVYKNIGDFKRQMLALTPQYFSPKAGMHHYLSMTRNIFEKDLQADNIRLKKYFYALRTSLAALWIAQKRMPPPMTLSELRVNLPPHLAHLVDNLIRQKAEATEKTEVPKHPDLHVFIQESIDFCLKITPQLSENHADNSDLNVLFKKILSEI